MRFSMIIKKSLIAAAISAMAIGMSTTAMAEEREYNNMKDPDYTESSTTWTVAGGVTARIDKGVLYIEGSGAMPDYTNDTISQRPYHTSIIGAVNVGAGITKIGERAFAEFPYLKYITVHSTTYIKNANAFHKIDNKPMLRIMGNKEAFYTEGGLTYNTVDSWKSLAHSQAYNIQFVVDDGALKDRFKQDSKNFVNVQSADTENIAAHDHVAYDDLVRERDNKKYAYTWDYDKQPGDLGTIPGAVTQAVPSYKPQVNTGAMPSISSMPSGGLLGAVNNVVPSAGTKATAGKAKRISR